MGAPKSLKKATAGKASPRTTDLAILLEYSFLQTEPSSSGFAGPYAELFDYRDETGKDARKFETPNGQQYAIWRCRYPFIIIFEDPTWTDYLCPPNMATPSLHWWQGEKYVPAAAASIHKPSADGLNYSLSLWIKPQPRVTGNPPKPPKYLYYTIIPDPGLFTRRRHPKGKGKIFSAVTRATIVLQS
jgi:hypothetical protein